MKVSIDKTLELTLLKLSSLGREIQRGLYPYKILKELGDLGLYASFYKEGQKGFVEAFNNIALISKTCVNTGFCVWAQLVLNYYLLHSHYGDKPLFRQIAYGEILGGSGLSNALKSFAGIEANKLRAKGDSKGYIINGTLPYVSNLGALEQGRNVSIFAFIAMAKSGHIMGLARCCELRLKDRDEFCAFKGSATKSVVFKDYCLPFSDVLSLSASSFAAKVAPGFVLLQVALSAGVTCGALQSLEKHQPHIAKTLEDKRQVLYDRALRLAKNPTKSRFKAILRLKIAFANLALKATQMALLCAQSKGYKEESKECKMALEAIFCANISPSFSHIQRILGS
ncbi:acyl-CoA/acyl-ACP dehydrogenase [Helicobacter marmotae]|uniref:Acyl-CoA dehydrogenase n=1 Tax=Helicobacter marmotae TaxID=152490 RepID=A0A3D8I5A4_9HELI|nr:acyl-CoA/acyl-ACP dehydrogenase [Helicobacter marmotae]RDU60340.1 acyl-CoA dehydrogenase [Helicobacter marmotae]